MGVTAASGRTHASADKIERIFAQLTEEMDGNRWSEFSHSVNELAVLYRSIPPAKLVPVSLDLVEISETLIKARKLDQGLSLLALILERRNALPERQAIGTKLIDIAEIMIRMNEGSRAQLILDDGYELVSSANTWAEAKDTARRRYERLGREVQKGSQPKTTSPRRPFNLRGSGSGQEPGAKVLLEMAFSHSIVHTTEQFSFNYVALAAKSAYLGGNTSESAIVEDDTTESHDQSSFAGAYGKLTARTARSTIENFNWTFGSQLIDQERCRRLYGEIPPPVPSLPFAKALSAPATATRLAAADDGSLMTLKPGDYVVSQLVVSNLYVKPAGRVRIFIEGDKLSKGPVFVDDGSVNDRDRLPDGRTSLEIWYNGEGTLKFEHNSSFKGLIYAPNARIELGPNNVRFVGAMVGRDIHADGNVQLIYDESLLRWRP